MLHVLAQQAIDRIAVCLTGIALVVENDPVSYTHLTLPTSDLV